MGNLDEPFVKNAVGEHVVACTPSTNVRGMDGNYYLKRPLVTQVGLVANLPEDGIYPLNLADDTGKPALQRRACASTASSARGTQHRSSAFVSNAP